ncbi:tellurium resistance protein TerC [Serinicoccus chungangensis]|uniref:Tellurium resistance protein TerC n=1 Tax=Serinicoccus chungangensis TaxID=767452 RepID=A0A0W8I6T3_9MICO|nr:TerC family protein [Serinicoccus chungangensis]KUG54293.1 tellurium resistance protein TerC [Serinicoccus chungangensis]
MDVPAGLWIATVGLVLVMLTVDLVGHVRTPHAPTLREATAWSVAYVGIGLLFGLVVLWQGGGEFAIQYYAGFLTEKSLSVDNLFVFVLIMNSFAVPRVYQQKVLFIGIIIALVLRTVFIFLGAAFVSAFAWIFYIFGLFLLWTAIAQLRAAAKPEDEEYHENGITRLTRRVLPTTETYVEGKMMVRVDGRLMITPMLIVMVAIGSADILFAVDSIPAIFGITQEVFLVFAANAFSLLGLRQLYFLVGGLLDRLVYLHYGLAAILAFISAKLLIHALHENELAFINGGEPVHAIPEIAPVPSLVVIVVILAVTTVASLVKSRSDRRTIDA